MAKTRTKEITIKKSKSGFILSKNPKISKKDYDFSGLAAIRHLLSNEKARMLNVIKTQHPQSMYELSKKLNRSFKSVVDDIRLLQRFGFIDLVEESTKKRKRYKPVIVVDNIVLKFKI